MRIFMGTWHCLAMKAAELKTGLQWATISLKFKFPLCWNNTMKDVTAEPWLSVESCQVTTIFVPDMLVVALGGGSGLADA